MEHDTKTLITEHATPHARLPDGGRSAHPAHDVLPVFFNMKQDICPISIVTYCSSVLIYSYVFGFHSILQKELQRKYCKHLGERWYWQANLHSSDESEAFFTSRVLLTLCNTFSVYFSICFYIFEIS
jgi:hypothetical protein